MEENMIKKKIAVVFGAKGLAGSAIVRQFKDVYFDVYEITHDMCDASNFQSVCDTLACLVRTPDVVVNCIAYSTVDIKNDEEAYKSYIANTVVPTKIGAACIRFKVPLLIHLSTDYVFNRMEADKIEAENQTYSPANVYGRCKLAGDMSLVGMYDNWNFRNEDDPLKLRIVRTSSLYGPDRKTFVDYVVDEYLRGGTIKALVSGDSIPTSTRYLSKYVVDLVGREIDKKEEISNPSRYFRNCVCSSSDWVAISISRFLFARKISEHLRDFNVPGQLELCVAKDRDFVALRPLHSRLEPSTDGPTPPDWDEELSDFLCEKLDKMGLLK